MKKIIALTLVLVFCMMSFAACGDKDKEKTLSQSTTKSSGTVKTVKASADDPVAVAELKKSENGFNLKGYINEKGKWVIAPQYEEAFPFVDNVATVMTKDDKWKLIDKNNKTIATFEDGVEVDTHSYTDLSEFNSYTNTISEGRIIITKDKLYGVADTKGNILVEPKYEHINAYSEGFAAVYINDDNGINCGYLDKKGNIVISGINEAHAFRSGLAYVSCQTQSAKYGYGGFINIAGELVIPMGSDQKIMTYGSNFYNGVALEMLKSNDAENASCTYGLIDKTGTILKELDGYINKNLHNSTLMAFNDGLCPVYLAPDENGTFAVGFVNTTGDLVIAPQTKWGVYDTGFSEGYCKVGANGKYGYIDKSGKIVIKMQYKEAKDFTHGLAAVKGDNGMWSFIDAKGKTVISIDDLTDVMPFTV